MHDPSQPLSKYLARRVAPAVLCAVGLVVWWMVGACAGQELELLTPEQARIRREYDAILRAERTPLPQTAWIAQQVKKGVVTNIVAKPLNAQAIWVNAKKFTKLTEFQRSTMISELARKQLPKANKPLPIAIYDTKPDGTRGKKIGTFKSRGGLALTIKFDEPEEFDNEADMFRLDPK